MRKDIARKRALQCNLFRVGVVDAAAVLTDRRARTKVALCDASTVMPS
jgi:hypothetical protein